MATHILFDIIKSVEMENSWGRFAKAFFGGSKMGFAEVVSMSLAKTDFGGLFVLFGSSELLLFGAVYIF